MKFKQKQPVYINAYQVPHSPQFDDLATDRDEFTRWLGVHDEWKLLPHGKVEVTAGGTMTTIANPEDYIIRDEYGLHAWPKDEFEAKYEPTTGKLPRAPDYREGQDYTLRLLYSVHNGGHEIWEKTSSPVCETDTCIVRVRDGELSGGCEDIIKTLESWGIDTLVVTPGMEVARHGYVRLQKTPLVQGQIELLQRILSENERRHQVAVQTAKAELAASRSQRAA